MNITNEFKNSRFTYYSIEDPQKKDFSRHMHYEYEILLFIEGDVSYVIENKRYELHPYDLLLIPSSCYHFADILSPARYSRYVIDFVPDTSERDIADKAFSGARLLHLDGGSHIVHAFMSLAKLSERGPYCELAAKSVLTEILLHVLFEKEELPISDEAGDDTSVSGVIEYINTHLCTIKSTDELAARFFISPSSLSHKFKSAMGISLMRYIKIKRLLLSKELITQGKKPTEVYSLCGFSNYTTFFRAYREYFGVSPTGR